MTVESIQVLVDLRTSDRTVDDQGQRALCVPISVTYAHERVRDDGVRLAAEALWQHALSRGAAADGHGTSLGAVGVALVEDGQPAEALWPYDPTRQGVQVPPTDAGPPPWHRAMLTAVPAAASDTIAELTDGRVVVAALALGAGFLTPVDGMIADPSGGVTAVMRHAVVIVGHGVAAGRDWLLIRNSWGPAWGEGGHAWISAAHFDACVIGASSISATL